ncbi:hypothetical protein B0T16DRAFT_454752 [Cercophora newfieldiana]|uniref:Uncharacterized protein n=1 Tax=Cercophora newfieldiana TaxID=92897 RepID=A0AA39YGU6_9PEZI|nr:hypothetical protein B0T16DRAFT_454752 [Cercophora newfieldiana]
MPKGSRNKIGTFIWYCCNCGDGPYNIHTTPACVSASCGRHHQCAHCYVEKRKVPDGSYKDSDTKSKSVAVADTPTRGPSIVADAPATTIPDSGYGTASRVPANCDAHLDDGASVSTDNMSVDMPGDQIEAYVNAFSRKLRNDTGLEVQSGQLIAHVQTLLRIFALRLATEDGSSEGRTAGLFVRQNKNRISRAFTEGLETLEASTDFGSDDSTDSQFRTSRAGIPAKERVDRWLYDMEGIALDEPAVDDLDAARDQETDESTDLGDMDMSRIEHVLGTASYVWLTSAIKNRALLDYSRADTQTSIRNALTDALTIPRGSRALQRHSIVLEMAWNPVRLIESQGYEGARYLLTALTITSTCDETNTQLLSCVQYVRQTWPLVGEVIASALVEATCISDTSSPKIAQRTLFDGTKISFQVVGEGCVKASCFGLFDSLSEVIEVLAWLGSAPRESSDPAAISHSLARLHRADESPLRLKLEFLERDEGLLVDKLDQMNISGRNTVQSHSQAPRLPTPVFPQGSCWKRIFKNPAVAWGFPVLARPAEFPGLEISLDAMALLVDAPRLTVFNQRAVLKGHNAAIVLTDGSRGSIMRWHFICNDNGSRLPFSDHRIRSGFLMEGEHAMEQIQGARHVLGWSPRVSYNIGSPLANYDIGWSSPAFVGPGCALEKFVLSGGPGFVTAGVELSLGRKDKSPLIKREMSGYFDVLGTLSSSYVILYDVRDHRAWLSNGLHTLLHLVRASLDHDQRGELAPECLFRASNLQEDSDPSNPQAAMNFLRNHLNLEQPIFRGSDTVRVEETTSGGTTTKTEYRSLTCVLLKDRVKYLASVLEELNDHQAGLDGFPGGIPLTLRTREKLEGFRFMDIATRRAATPRVIRLNTPRGMGRTWVDFTRSIKAMTLFGEGFGELLEPSPGSDCPMWKTLPRGRDHLAVSSYDLSKILRQEGDADACPAKLAPGVFWEPTALFETCACLDQKRKSCDPVQSLLSEPLFKGTTKKKRPGMKLYDDIGKRSAIVFGRGNILPYLRWPSRREP